MAYALIVMLWVGSHGVATHHVPMANAEVCETSRVQMLTVHDSARIGTIKAFCVRTQ